MAEGGRGGEKRVRCRKCRHILLEEPPHRMMTRKEEEEHIIPLYEDQLPDWMAEAVQEVIPKLGYVTAGASAADFPTQICGGQAQLAEQILKISSTVGIATAQNSNQR